MDHKPSRLNMDKTSMPKNDSNKNPKKSPLHSISKRSQQKFTDENLLKAQIQPDKMPRHVAIIMDGNGRWAKKRKLGRVFGHRAGIKTVRNIVETSAEIGIEVLTLFAFSVQNWKRPKSEVNTLMNLLVKYLEKELPTMMKNDIRLMAIGELKQLPEIVQEKLVFTIKETDRNHYHF